MNGKNKSTNPEQISRAKPHDKSSRHRLTILGLLLAVFFAQGLTAEAATFTVTNTTDLNDGVCDADCSLREAIASARTALGDDTVAFDLSLDGQTIALTDEISIRPSNGVMNGAITINGLGADRLTIDGGEGLNRLFIFTMGTVTINDVTMTGGNGAGHNSGYGGAIMVLDSTLNLNRSRVTGNYSPIGGGGLLAANSAQVTITDSTFDQNTNPGSTGTAFGGAINAQGSGTTLNLVRSRVTGNFASGGGGGLTVTYSAQVNITDSTIDQNESLCQGGAIDSSLGATVNITNSTVSGNVADKPGGGISQSNDAGTMTITNSTVTNNTAIFFGGGLARHFEGGAPFIIRNSIVAGNTITAPFEQEVPMQYMQYTDIFSYTGLSFTSEGFNLIGVSDGSTSFTDGTNNDKAGSIAHPINPRLGSLADNGGPTPTHKLLPGSPAIDKGNSFGLTTDQRGFRRPVDFPLPNAPGGDGADIGAFEVGKEQCKNGGWMILGFQNQGQCQHGN